MSSFLWNQLSNITVYMNRHIQNLQTDSIVRSKVFEHLEYNLVLLSFINCSRQLNTACNFSYFCLVLSYTALSQKDLKYDPFDYYFQAMIAMMMMVWF